MAGRLYAALRAANVPEAEAAPAAEEASRSDGRFYQIDDRFQKFDDRFQRVETDLTVLKWMAGAGLALQLGLIGAIVAFAINHATFH